jgi:hypothetical protein
VLQKSTIATCTSPCTIINQRGAAGGVGCCATHTTVYFFIIINQRARRRLRRKRVRDGAVCTTYITAYYHQLRQSAKRSRKWRKLETWGGATYAYVHFAVHCYLNDCQGVAGGCPKGSVTLSGGCGSCIQVCHMLRCVSNIM